MDPLVIVAQACGLWSSSAIVAAPPQPQLRFQNRAPEALEPESCCYVNRNTDLRDKVRNPFALAGREQHARSRQLGELDINHVLGQHGLGEEAYNLKYGFVMDFFGAGDGDEDMKQCLYRCVNMKRLSIAEKLAMMKIPLVLPESLFDPRSPPQSLPSFIQNNLANLVHYLLGQRHAHEYNLARNAKDDSFKKWGPHFQVFTLAASDAFGPRLLAELCPATSNFAVRRGKRKKTQNFHACKVEANELIRLRRILKVMRTARRRWRKALEKRRNRM